jgi:cytochrome c-type biogenesis protein CcsB
MLAKRMSALLLGVMIVAMAGAAMAQQPSAPEWEADFPRVSDRMITLKWKEVSGAEEYNIYRAGELIHTIKATKHIDKDPQLGDNVYAISAVKNGVEGPLSVEKTATLEPMQPKTASSSLVNFSFLAFFLAIFAYAFYNFMSANDKKRLLGYGGSLLLFLGMVMMTVAIALRWIEAERPPFSNMYESLILFAWSIALIYLILELIYKTRIAGMIAALLAAASIAAASFFNPTIEPLMPALQSNWLAYHVLTCFVGYAAFAVSAAVSLVSLYRMLKHDYGINMIHIPTFVFAAIGIWVEHALRNAANPYKLAASIMFGYAVFFILYAGWIGIMMYVKREAKPGTSDAGDDFKDLTKMLQSLNYESIRFGFLFLLVGIITGAVWANEAWGTYWSWDPKETWSLITWIIYAIVLHFKYVSGRFGIKNLSTFYSVCSILGFHAVIFTYFGVNFILSGLHSYA